MDHVGLLLQDIEAGGSVVGKVSHLYLQTGRFSHDLKIVRLESEGVLEAFGCLYEVLLLLIDAGTSMPTEHAPHLAFHEGKFGDFEGLGVLPQCLEEEGLEGVGLGVFGMQFQQFLCTLDSLFVVFGVVEFLSERGLTASCL